MDRPQAELKSALSSLSKSEKYSDFTIICQDRRYRVHKALLCSRSRFFDGACNGHFAESRTGEIDLSEEDEEAVEHMIHYFYHLDYLEDDGAVDQPKTAPMWPRQHARKPGKLDFTKIEDPLLATAHASNTHQTNNLITPLRDLECSTEPRTSSAGPSKQPINKQRRRQSAVKSKADHTLCYDRNVYDRSELQYQSDNEHLGVTMEDDMESEFLVHARVYALAEKYEIYGLKALAKAKFEVLSMENWDDPGFIEVLEEVYTTTIDQDRGLREVVLQVFRKNPGLAYRMDVRNAIRDVPAVAYDLRQMT